MKNRKRFIYIICLVLIVATSFYYLKAPYEINPSKAFLKPNRTYILGTDYLGRDLFSRLLLGTFNSLMIAAFCLVCVGVVSLVLGGLAGGIGGILDKVITLVSDVIYSLPSSLLALVFAGFFGNDLSTIILAFIISWSGKYVRYIRNLVIDISKQEYVKLAYQRGSTKYRTIFKYILPNTLSSLVSLFVTDIGNLVLNISGLSFLGIGVKPPMAELGTLLYDAKEYFFNAPWLIIPPGVMLITIVSISQLYGDKLVRRKEALYA